MGNEFVLNMKTIYEAYDNRKKDWEHYVSVMYETLSRLMSSLARKWSSKAKGNQLATIEDLKQEAVAEMLKELPSYDPYVSKPSTYFLPRLEAHLKDVANTYQVKVSGYYNKMIVNVDETLKNAGIRDGINDVCVTIDLISDVMDISPKTAKYIFEFSRRQYGTLEDPDYIGSLLETTPEDQLIHNQENEELVQACTKLTDLQKYLIVRHIFDGVSHRKLVTELKKDEKALKLYSLDKRQVTSVYLKQMESKALRKLKGTVDRQQIKPAPKQNLFMQASDEDIAEAFKNGKEKDDVMDLK